MYYWLVWVGFVRQYLGLLGAVSTTPLLVGLTCYICRVCQLTDVYIYLGQILRGEFRSRFLKERSRLGTAPGRV